MLRNRGLGQRQLVHDVAADARAPTNQNANDLNPRRMPDGFRQCRELLIGLLTLNRPKVRLGARNGATVDGKSFVHRRLTIELAALPVKLFDLGRRERQPPLAQLEALASGFDDLRWDAVLGADFDGPFELASTTALLSSH